MLTNITGYLSSYFEGEEKKKDTKNDYKEPSNHHNFTPSIIEDLSDDDIVILAKPNEYWGDDEGNSEENNEEEDKDDDEEKDENDKSKEDENIDDTDIDDISISSEGELIDMVVGYDDLGSSDSLNDYEYVENTHLNTSISSHTNNIHIPNTTTNKILIPHINSSNSKRDALNIPCCNHITPNRQIPNKHSNKRRRQALLKETTPENSDFESYRGPYFNFHRDLWGDQEILTDASDQPEIMSSPSFEESWLVTPAPCFEGTDLVKMVKGSMEDLLLKGPTVSIYQKFLSQKDNRKISGGGSEGGLSDRMAGCDDKIASDCGEEGGSEGRYNSCVEENEDELVPGDECDVRTECSKGDYPNQMDCKYDSDDANVVYEQEFYSKDIFEINGSLQKEINNGDEYTARYDKSMLKLEMINDSEERYFENSINYNLKCIDSGFNSCHEGIIDFNYIYNINHQKRNAWLLSSKALSVALDEVLKSSGYNGRLGDHSNYQISDLASFRTLTPTESLMENKVTTLSKDRASAQTIIKPINVQSTSAILKEEVFKSEILSFLNKMRLTKRNRNLQEKCKTNSFKKINNNHHHVKKNYHHYHHPYHSQHYQRAL